MSMKLCTKVAVRSSHVKDDVRVIDDLDVIDVSLVDDGHEFGPMPDGTLHIEGRL
jgi:hypothetical protein